MMQIDGSCLCGSVSFEATVDPRRVFICHCTDCQTQSGPFRTIVGANPGSFELNSGKLKVYEKKAEGGATRRLAFCPDCGTSIYGGPPDGEPGFLSLRVGPIRQRSELHPVAQLWCRSSQSWLEGLGDLPRIATQPRISGDTSPD